MIRTLNILIVLLSVLAAWLWNTDADGAQIFVASKVIASYRRVGTG